MFSMSMGKEGYGQGEADNWYFGEKAGLNFSTCNPTILTGSALNTIEGVATISAPDGQLLFYTDGITVWNKQHLQMENGFGLNGDPSSTQSAVIVPLPGNTNIYYIFTIDAESGHKGLCYSIVNISNNGGLGKVIEKNTILLNQAHEKLTAVRHANKNDVWVITRQLDSEKYFTFLVTSEGIINTPIISNSGNYIGPTQHKSRGYLKTSPDGSKIVSAFNNVPFLELSYFNNQTGVISNTLKIAARPYPESSTSVMSSYGVEFSPNNQQLYIATSIVRDVYCTNCIRANNYIHQYNVTTFDSLAIAHSVVLIDSGATAAKPGITVYGAIQLAKNGRMYIAQVNENTLSVINNPDASGISCGFAANSISLGGKISMGGLPTFIQSYFDPNYRNYDFDYTQDCNKNIAFMLNTTYPYDSLKWDFGDIPSGLNNNSTNADVVHTYLNDGVYSIKLFVYNTFGCNIKIDSIKKDIKVGNTWFDLGIDKNICPNDTLTLNASVVGASSYNWSTGASSEIIKVFEPGIYWCDVTKDGCTFRDSLTVGFYVPPVINLGSDTTLCEGNTIILSAANPGATYLWQDNNATSSYTVKQPGNYYVTVTKDGCEARDTIVVSYTLKPRFYLGGNQTLCMGQPIILKPKLDISWKLLWQDGRTEPTYTINQEGLYSLIATNECGATKEDINIKKGICKIYIPQAFTPAGNNKILKVLGTEEVKNFSFRIYNRFGQLIFLTNDKFSGWDGKYKGVLQPAGLYVWVVKYSSSNDKVEYINGASFLIR